MEALIRGWATGRPNSYINLNLELVPQRHLELCYYIGLCIPPLTIAEVERNHELWVQAEAYLDLNQFMANPLRG